jgi:short-subunit dehydrogenase
MADLLSLLSNGLRGMGTSAIPGGFGLPPGFTPAPPQRPVGGFTPVPGQAIYGASKAAVKLLTEALYAELKETSVQVTIVFPGALGTNITKNSGVDMKLSKEDTEKMASSQKTLSPEKAADLIITKAIQQGRYRLLVGQDASMFDKISRFNPKFATNMIAKAMKSLLK